MEKMQVDFGLTDYEIERLKIHIAKRNKEGWKGSCFGMTVSAILAKQGDLKLSNYGCDDVVYQNNPFTSNAMSVINFIHGIRGLYNYQKWLRQSLYMPKSFDQYDYINKIEEVLQNENRLVELEYGIKKYNKYSEKYDTYGYHAVIMYGIEDCNYYSSVTGKRYDKKILIADPNYMSGRNVDDNACMYYRSSDHSWIIPYWNKDYSSCTYLCYWNSNSTLSTKTGDISNIIVYDSLVENEDLMADSTLDHYIAGIEIDNISKNKTYIQQVKNTGESNLNYSADLNSNVGEYNIAMNDILIDDIEMDDIDVAYKDDTEYYSLWNPTANYELYYEQPSDYYATMDYEGLTYIVDVKNSTYNLFTPNGYIELKGNNADFYISILTDTSQSVTDWISVGVLGNGIDSLTYEKNKDGYILSAPNLKNITVNARNKYVDISKTFSTDYDSVLIYEIDKNTIGLKVDTDSNGTYETDITQPKPLENLSVLSTETVKLGKTVTVNAEAIGGTAPYQYNILYKQTSQTKWTTAQSYKSNATVTFKPAKATTYDVCVKVKDSNGTIVKKFFTVQVNGKLTNTSAVSATEIKKGNVLTVDCSATGGAGDYTYAVFYKQKAQTKWTTKQDFNENSVVSIKPAKITDYDICVKVKDKDGTIIKKYFTVKVTK